MMNFNEFKRMAEENILSVLPERYKDAQVEIHESRKLNDRYTGMSVCVDRDGTHVAPLINLEQMYEKYQMDGDFDIALNRMAEIVMVKAPDFNLESLMDYDSVKDRLFVRVSAVNGNEEVLKSVPYREVSDLAVTCHILVDEDKDRGLATINVNYEILEKFGVSQETLFKDALENSANILPERIATLDEMITDMLVQNLTENCMYTEEEARAMAQDLLPESPEPPVYVITNDKGINGASAMFYEGVLDKMAEKIGGDFYILPSSIHESLAVRDDGDMELDVLKGMVMTVNETEVMSEDKLSDEVYHYDVSERRFERADDYIARESVKAEVVAENTIARDASFEDRPLEAGHDDPERDDGGLGL